MVGACHLKAFMDDDTVICLNEDEKFKMFESLDCLRSWFRSNMKPNKSRSLSERNVKTDSATTFTVLNKQIPTVSQ